MRGWYFVVGLVLSISTIAPASTEDLAVANASFEDYVLPAGAATSDGVGLDSWTPEPGNQVGVWNVSDLTDYPGGAPDGVNVAYSQGPSISQVLSDVVVEGMTYALTVEVGNSPCCAFLGYGVQLLANGVVLAEDANSIPADPATFETVLVTYTSPPGDPNAGETLEIRLLALGPEVTFDDVTLTRIDCAPANLVAFWPAEGTAQDVAGVYDGILESGATFSSGKVRQALSFNGDQAQVTLTTFPTGNTFSIEGWVYYLGSSTPPWTTIYADGNHGFFLNDLRLSWWDYGERFAGSSQISVAEWHHVAITYDAGLSIFTGYVDGVPDGTSTFAGAALPPGEPVVSIGGHDLFLP